MREVEVIGGSIPADGCYHKTYRVDTNMMQVVSRYVRVEGESLMMPGGLRAAGQFLHKDFETAYDSLDTYLDVLKAHVNDARMEKRKNLLQSP